MSGVQSIERAFSILRVLSLGPLGVTDIAERTELPKSTVSRLLAALEREGAVMQVEAGGGYSIGSTLATLGDAASPTASSAIGGASLRRGTRRWRPAGAPASPCVDGDQAYWVDNVDDADELVTLADQTGQSFPLHAVATGLAMLAKFSDAELDRYLAASGCGSRANGSLADAATLRQRLKAGARRRCDVVARGTRPGRQRGRCGVPRPGRQLGRCDLRAGPVVPLSPAPATSSASSHWCRRRRCSCPTGWSVADR